MKKLSLAILGNRNFRFLLLTRVFAMMALQAQSLIVGWQVYSITNDPFMLGLTGLVEAVPAILCALVAGHIVDITQPRRIFQISIFVEVLNTLALFLVAGGFLDVAHDHVLIGIYTGVFISGLARAFIMPSSFTVLSQIVERRELPSASAWLGSSAPIAAIVGPSVAGIIYASLGVRNAWLLPVSLSMISLIMVTLLRTPVLHRMREHKITAFQSIQEGWHFILKNQVLLSVMALDMFTVLFGGAVAMLPAFADQILHIGSEGLGVLRAAPALGAIITALMLALFPMKNISARNLLFVSAGFGLCMIGFGLSHVFWLSLLFLALSGMFDSVSVVIRSTLMQLLTPDHMRGRVSSVNSMFIISSNEIGAFESGLAARFLGLVPSVVFGGIGTLLVAGTTAILSPKMRHIIVHADEDVK